MALQFQRKFQYKGITIRDLILPSPDEVAAISEIKVFKFEPIISLGFSAAQAEFLARRRVYGDLEGFNWFVDKKSVWHLGAESGTILVGVCDDKAATTRRNLIRTLTYICETFDLGLNQICLTFNDLELFEELSEFIHSKELPKITEEEIEELVDIPKQEIIPAITCSLYKCGEWGSVAAASPIEAIKIHSSVGKLSYRVFAKGTWFPWVGGNEQSGVFTYPIKGFQFDFQDDEFELQYRCTLVNGEEKDWRNTSLQIPYKKNIANLEFKLVKK